MKPKLFDASAILTLIGDRPDEASDELEGAYILDLTPYEVGNAIWKIHRLLHKADESTLLNAVDNAQSILSNMAVLPLGGLDEMTPIIKIEYDRSLTFYDSAYLHTAKKMSLTLMTEDERLLDAAAALKVKYSRI